ncbi:hypothetical protein EHW66_17900 [Erwinia psidii]|uniref:Uncharacterized protein n=1 Tax=Erwinia psidii TaxID=69224 RepID=A0A3N6SEJ2_9GAMM|nr:hypothetical protein [Erwinia psidii]MCX8961548.1 hypothetical protein [Erwinia psidii]MCX8966788.1 hypothetical protein [Erwinia psidii]RQM39870.1 hypothetical protein EB241_00710 [Erwinia psidii]
MQGNLVDIQTHGKLSFMGPRRVFNHPAMQQSTDNNINQCIAIKVQKKSYIYGRILPFDTQ